MMFIVRAQLQPLAEDSINLKELLCNLKSIKAGVKN